MSMYLIILNRRACVPDQVMKNGIPGAQYEKRPRDCRDIDEGMLIPWLNTDREMDIRSSRNGEWKFGKTT